MPTRYQVTKTLRMEYQVDAETEADALAAAPPDGAGVEVLRQRARDTERKPSAGRPALQDWELRLGRKLVAKYKGTEWIAEVRADGIALHKKGGTHVETYSSLAKAATSIIDGRAVNAWFLFRDPEPAAKPATQPKASKTAKPTVAQMRAAAGALPAKAPEPTEQEGQAS